MKKKIWIGILIILLLFVVSKIYTGIKDSELMKNTNTQLESLLEPYINNTVIVMNEDKFYCRINHAKLSDNVEVYKKELRCSAYVTFDVYKNEVKEENLYDTMGIYMDVWRLNLEGDFFASGTGRDSELSYKREIFQKMAYHVSHVTKENLKRKSSLEDHGTSYTSSRGHGRLDEDNIKINEYGEITSPGEVKYSYIEYSEDLSMKFTTKFYIEDFKKYHEMHIKVEKAEGDYHPLWDLKADNINEITFYKKDNHENRRTISDSSTILELVEYLKSMPFTKYEEQGQNVGSVYYIAFDKYQHDFRLTENAVYTNFDHANCIGEEYVNDILEILSRAK